MSTKSSVMTDWDFSFVLYFGFLIRILVSVLSFVCSLKTGHYIIAHYFLQLTVLPSKGLGGFVVLLLINFNYHFWNIKFLTPIYMVYNIGCHSACCPSSVEQSLYCSNKTFQFYLILFLVLFLVSFTLYKIITF